MNMRHEAIIWSLAVGAAVILALAVVWGAIALAFNRPNLEPLYFSATHYRQDDYGAESADTMRLSPLDPALEQEVILEDLARGNLVLKVNYVRLANVSAPEQPAPALTNPPSSPTSADTALPVPTHTPVPERSNTPASIPTLTPKPLSAAPSTVTPASKQPAPKPKPKKTPKPARVKDGDHGQDHGGHGHGHKHDHPKP